MRDLFLHLMIAGLLFPAFSKAQSLNQDEKKSIEKILNDHAKGIRAGVIKIDSTAADGDTLTLYVNDNLQDIPIRDSNYQSITHAVGQILAQRFADKAVKIVTDGHELRTLIPRITLSKREKRPAFTYPAGIPLTRNLDRPYKPTRGLYGRHIAMWQSHGWYYEQGLARWEWQRARLFQTVEDKYTQTYVVPYLIPMLENAGAIVMTPRERDANPYEVIVDNDGALAATSTYREQNGSRPWQTGRDKGFAYTKEQYKDFENPFTDGTYREAETVTKPSEAGTIAWIPDIPKTHRYAVYVAYNTQINSTDGASYTVYHKGGKTTFTVNQTMGGGTWVYLGTFMFDKGTKGRVELTNLSKKAGQIVTADAVRFGGGMGNIARRTDGDSIATNMKSTRKNDRLPRNACQPKIDYPYEVSGYPRFEEAARYWLQWAGIPDSIYSPSHGKNDYTDDYKCRGIWVNYLAGGTKAVPDAKGLGIPIDLSLAFHSDAGCVYGDSIIGTLGIYQTDAYNGKYADGTSRDANRDLCDLVLTSITNDIRTLYEPKWTRRGMWNSRYFEAWTPRVPAMLLELLSHNNFADMRYGLDPRFHFTVSRAVYKGILRFLSDEYGYDYVVQPLPVSHFAAILKEKNEVTLSWQAVTDSLEPTAKAEKYIVYTRVGDTDFDNGVVVKKNSYTCKIPADQIVSFKITAINKGGESFPSEILSVGISSAAQTKPVLVVNGFNRISAPDDFRSADDEQAGFLADQDNGVPYRNMITYVGKMKEFRRVIPWTDDDSSGFGDSYGNCEKMVIAGNTFDYPALHGAAILKAGYSFASVSRDALTAKDILNTDDYCALDLILGKQKQSKMGRGGVTPLRFKTFDIDMQQILTRYCQAGGRVFVSGSYVGTDLWQNSVAPANKEDQDFAQRILKYKWRDNRAALEGNIRYVASPLTEDRLHLTYYNKPNEDSYVVESPDAIDPADACAYTAFRYTENNLSAGIVFGGNESDRWRTVVLGFPFEAVTGSTDRDVLMQKILQYLLK